MGITYYATRISENISRTPDEGFLLCRNCVLARTGFQAYPVNEVTKDLTDEEIKELGLEGVSPNSVINLYRPAEEVFAPATIASGEGKTFTDDHPSTFVTSENFKEYARGHVQNVHKGDEALESGEWPLMGDILVTDEEVIDKIENKKVRELSCGYRHLLKRDGNKIIQYNIVINHVALVKKGRAGPEARINDSDGINIPPELLEAAELVEKNNSEKKEKKFSEKDKKEGIVEFGRERKNMTKDKSTGFQKILGMVIKAMAKDESTSPEELAEATRELHEKTSDHGNHQNCTPGEMGHEKCTDEACMAGKMEKPMEEKPMEKPHEMDAERKKHHDLLDRLLDKREAMLDSVKKDADLEGLRKLLNEYLGEEEKEPEHQDEALSADPVEEEEKEMEKVGDGKEMSEKHESEVLEPIEEDNGPDLEEIQEQEEEGIKNDAAAAMLPHLEKKDKKVNDAFDAALEKAGNNEKKFLVIFKPTVKMSKDSEMISEFNTQLRRVTGKSVSQDSSYATFSQAAKVRKTKDGTPSHEFAELESAYEKVLKGDK